MILPLANFSTSSTNAIPPTKCLCFATPRLHPLLDVGFLDFPLKSLPQHDVAARLLLVADHDAHDGGVGDGFVLYEDGFEFGRTDSEAVDFHKFL